MGLLDDLFGSGKKSKFEETMDGLMDKVVNTASETFEKPVMKKAIGTINDAADGITSSLEEMLHGETVSAPASDRTKLPDFDANAKKWDAMIDAIAVKELQKYRVCPNCGNASPAENKYCSECGTLLPEHTAEVRLCPKCGAKNDVLAETCAVCGADMPLIPEADK